MLIALTQIARASVAGGLTVSAVMQAVGGDAGTVLGATSTGEDMRRVSRDNPPGTLKSINTEKLDNMGMDKQLVRAFVENPTYTPTERTLLVGELETMGGVAGRDVFISIANLATDESTALNWRVVAQLMAGYHARVAPVAQIVNMGGYPVLRRKDGGVASVGAEDYIYLTEAVHGWLQIAKETLQKMQGVKNKEIWTSGKVDPELSKFCSALGYQVIENAGQRLLK